MPLLRLRGIDQDDEEHYYATWVMRDGDRVELQLADKNKKAVIVFRNGDFKIVTKRDQ